MKQLKLTIVIITCGLYTLTMGQKQQETIASSDNYHISERVLLILNQDFFLAGESITFQATTYEAALKIPIAFSSILYLEVYNQDQQVVVAQKRRLQNGITQGKITLPKQLSTDYYYIRAYTNYMKNEGLNAFFTQRIRVVNPFIAKDASQTPNAYLSTNVDNEEQHLLYPQDLIPQTNLTINAEVDIPNPTQGDSIQLSITRQNQEETQYFVALLLSDSLTNQASILQSFSNDEDHSESYLAEINKDVITGHITPTDKKKSVAHRLLSLAFIDSIPWLNKTTTDRFGHFKTTIPLEGQNSRLCLSIQDTNLHYTVTIDNEYYPYFPDIRKTKYHPNPSLKHHIEARMKILQVNDAYKQANKTTEEYRIPFYGKPCSKYFFKDYNNLPTLEEFIYEVVDEAIPQRKNKELKLAIISENRTYGIHPLVLLDGQPIIDLEPLLKKPCTAFNALKIVNTRFYHHNEIYDGIVDITSKKQSLDIINNQHQIKQLEFPPVVEKELQTAVPQMPKPDYRTQLLQDTILSKENTYQCGIKLPNNSGKYTLVVYATTPEGNWGYLRIKDFITIQAGH